MYDMDSAIDNRNVTAIGYIRVSTAGQAQDGVSLDAQRSQLLAWAAREGLVIEVYADEGKSGKSRKGRPGLAAAIAAAKRGRLPLVVWNLSRLSRDTRDSLDIAAELNVRRAKLVSLSENLDTRTPAGELAFTMFSAINQHQRRERQDQTRDGLRELRAQGRRFNNDAPYGYRWSDDGRIVECAREQFVLDVIRRARAEGMSFQSIADHLAGAGVVGRSGAPMKRQTVERVFKRPPERIAA